MNDNKKTVKVIHMAPLGSGGISKLTVTINELIADNIQFDYLVFRNKKEFLENKAISLGGKKQVIDVANIKNDFLKFFIKMRAMVNLIQTGSNMMLFMWMLQHHMCHGSDCS